MEIQIHLEAIIKTIFFAISGGGGLFFELLNRNLFFRVVPLVGGNLDVLTNIVYLTSYCRIPDKEEKSDFKSCIEERSNNIKTICDQNRDALKWQKKAFKRNLRNHVWDFSNQIVYCPIAKVASSTWFTNFVKLLNIDLEKLEYLKQARIPLTFCEDK